MNKCTERLYNGIVKENPTFVLMLGMCPTLAVTTSAINGLGMGLSTTVVLMFSNMLIAALRKIIPDRVRIPAYIVIVATLVTIVQLLLQAYVPSLNAALGIYIPLIVVNCIILGRAESYASKNPVMASTFDGKYVPVAVKAEDYEAFKSQFKVVEDGSTVAGGFGENNLQSYSAVADVTAETNGLPPPVAGQQPLQLSRL